MLFRSRFVDVADRDEIDIGQAGPLGDVIASLAVDANHGDTHFVIGANAARLARFDGKRRLAQRASRQRGRGSKQRAINKFTARKLGDVEFHSIDFRRCGGSITLRRNKRCLLGRQAFYQPALNCFQN